MAEKLYETCAKQVQIIIQQHRQEFEKIGEAVQKVSIDPERSELGRNNLISKLRDELKQLNKTKTDEMKAVVTNFCNQYQVIHVDDGKADAQEVANALKVIDMCGYNLTADLLRSVAEPLKKSYTALKMIRQLMEAKNDNSGLGFSTDVLSLMDDYIGVNAEIIAYVETFELVKAVLDMPELCSAGIVGIPEINGQVVNRLIDETHYAVLTLGDNMMKVGQLYDSVHLEYPRLFK